MTPAAKPGPQTAAGRALLLVSGWLPESEMRKRAIAIEAEAAQQERERIRAALVKRSCDCGDGKHRPTWSWCKAHGIIAILDAPESASAETDPPPDAGEAGS